MGLGAQSDINSALMIYEAGSETHILNAKNSDGLTPYQVSHLLQTVIQAMTYNFFVSYVYVQLIYSYPFMNVTFRLLKPVVVSIS
jgi:hypothetical protein